MKEIGIRRIEVTVDPENEPSLRLFRSSGYTNISRQEGETVHVLENLAVKDYYSPGRHFMLFDKLIRNRFFLIPDGRPGYEVKKGLRRSLSLKPVLKASGKP